MKVSVCCFGVFLHIFKEAKQIVCVCIYKDIYIYGEYVNDIGVA